MDEAAFNSDTYVAELLSFETIVILAGRGMSNQEHPYWNSILSKATMWKIMRLAAQQAVHDAYRLPETNDDFTPLGIARLAKVLNDSGKTVHVVTDMIDGFFERVGIASARLTNLCGSVEEMMKFSEASDPPQGWTAHLSGGLRGDRLEVARNMIEGLVDRGAYVIAVGIQGNTNFTMLENAVANRFRSMSVEKPRAEKPKKYTYELEGSDVDEIVTGLAISIYTKTVR